MMKATIQWQPKVKFIAKSGSGHTVTMDGPPDQGGENQGFRPMEMVLIGMGGCTAFDVIKILEKSRQKVTDCTIELSATRADSIPSVFENIHVHFIVTGKDLNEKQVQRAISLSAEKYCSASLMLQRGGVNITHDYKLITSN